MPSQIPSRPSIFGSGGHTPGAKVSAKDCGPCDHWPTQRPAPASHLPVKVAGAAAIRILKLSASPLSVTSVSGRP